MTTIKEFFDFLKEYNILALAIAFIIGLAANSLVKSFVDNIIMPFVSPLIPEGGWRTATWAIGAVELRWGPFLSEVIYFVIIAFVVFLIAKKILKEEKVSKK